MDNNVSTNEIIRKSSCVMSNLFEKLVFQYCSCLKFGIWTFFFDFPKRLPTTFKSANHVMHICILLYRIIHFHNISSKFVFENVVLPHLIDNNAFIPTSYECWICWVSYLSFNRNFYQRTLFVKKCVRWTTNGV